jgi:hypothetical protein
MIERDVDEAFEAMEDTYDYRQVTMTADEYAAELFLDSVCVSGETHKEA